MSLEDALKKWAQSPEGKKKLHEAGKQAAKRGVIYGGGGASHPPDYYAQEARRILSEEIQTAGFEYGDYLIMSAPVWDDALGKWVITMNFDPAMSKRDSLYPEGYPDGAEDIVALMNHGYSARGVVYGYWPKAGKQIRSLQSRNGAYFIQQAASWFNQKYAGEAVLEWDEKYNG